MMDKRNRTVFLDAAATPIDNPLKGFMPFAQLVESPDYNRSFPHSMEWGYVGLSDLMSGYDQFTFEQGLEPLLERIASRHHQAALRVYLDYPSQPTGVPQFLLDEGVVLRPYEEFGGGLCPDYYDPRLLKALRQFIQAFGHAYDGDPRIGFITVGLVGFWGEWHTYPYDGKNRAENWMPSSDDQHRILQAYVEAFSQTKLLVRIPTAGSSALAIGYHDDSFAFSTLGTHDYDFLPLLTAAGELGKWKTQPIGGELRPELQNGIWEREAPAEAEDYFACVQATHASWLINQGVFRSKFLASDRAYEQALAGSRSLGYEFSVVKVSYRLSEAKIDLTVHWKNLGVAPFYYDWPIELGVFRTQTGQLVARHVTPWRLTQILPQPNPWELRAEMPWPAHGPKSGLALLMRVVNPLPGGKALAFGNREQDRDLKGWLSLADLLMDNNGWEEALEP